LFSRLYKPLFMIMFFETLAERTFLTRPKSREGISEIQSATNGPK
jgi:hypothetical protein